MKLFIYIILSVTLLSLNSYSQDLFKFEESDSKGKGKNLLVYNLNNSKINLGPYYPGTIEEVNHKKFLFKIDGQKNKRITWEIMNTPIQDINVKAKYFGSDDGYCWVQISSCGYSKLNNHGHYYIRIELQEVEVKTGARKGINDTIYMITADYQ